MLTFFQNITTSTSYAADADDAAADASSSPSRAIVQYGCITGVTTIVNAASIFAPTLTSAMNSTAPTSSIAVATQRYCASESGSTESQSSPARARIASFAARRRGASVASVAPASSCAIAWSLFSAETRNTKARRNRAANAEANIADATTRRGAARSGRVEWRCGSGRWGAKISAFRWRFVPSFR